MVVMSRDTDWTTKLYRGLTHLARDHTTSRKRLATIRSSTNLKTKKGPWVHVKFPLKTSQDQADTQQTLLSQSTKAQEPWLANLIAYYRLYQDRNKASLAHSTTPHRWNWVLNKKLRPATQCWKKKDRRLLVELRLQVPAPTTAKLNK